MRIDAHQHFWKYDPVAYDWITDDMAVIRRDFLPDDLRPVLQANNFDGCVAVQAEQTEAETERLVAYANANPFIKGVVGWVDLCADNVDQRLEYYRQFPALKGFRHVLQGEPDRAFMLRPDFKRGIGLLDRYHFTYDILIFPDQLAFSAEMVKAFPQQKFVIDHIAKPDIKGKQITDWQKQIQQIAQYENVGCKVSGMVTEADVKNWNNADLTPYLDVVTDTFGTNRLIFGSDWPVCLTAASYKQVLYVIDGYYSKTELAMILGGNASTFYNL